MKIKEETKAELENLKQYVPKNKTFRVIGIAVFLVFASLVCLGLVIPLIDPVGWAKIQADDVREAAEKQAREAEKKEKKEKQASQNQQSTSNQQSLEEAANNLVNVTKGYFDNGGGEWFGFNMNMGNLFVAEYGYPWSRT